MWGFFGDIIDKMWDFNGENVDFCPKNAHNLSCPAHSIEHQTLKSNAIHSCLRMTILSPLKQDESPTLRDSRVLAFTD